MQVDGTVTFKSAPLTTGTVRFNPVDPKKGHMAEGKIDSSGKFKLSTFKPGDGVLAGDYDITVVSMAESDKGLAKDKGLGIGDKSVIPEKYNNPKTSGLKETVKPGESKTNLKLDLKE